MAAVGIRSMGQTILNGTALVNRRVITKVVVADFVAELDLSYPSSMQ
jgi:hypothetical protein